MTDTFAAIGPELHAKLAGVVARNRLPGAVADGRVCAISLFDATFARLDPVVAG